MASTQSGRQPRPQRAINMPQQNPAQIQMQIQSSLGSAPVDEYTLPENPSSYAPSAVQSANARMISANYSLSANGRLPSRTPRGGNVEEVDAGVSSQVRRQLPPRVQAVFIRRSLIDQPNDAQQSETHVITPPALGSSSGRPRRIPPNRENVPIAPQSPQLPHSRERTARPGSLTGNAANGFISSDAGRSATVPGVSDRNNQDLRSNSRMPGASAGRSQRLSLLEAAVAVDDEPTRSQRRRPPRKAVAVPVKQKPANIHAVQLVQEDSQFEPVEVDIGDLVNGYEEEWDENSDQGSDIFRPGRGTAVKNVRSSAKQPDEADFSRLPSSPMRAAGKSFKQQQPPKSQQMPVNMSEQSADADMDDDITEEMDDLDYIDSLSKVGMQPPRTSKQIPKQPISSSSNIPTPVAAKPIADPRTTEKLADLQNQLDKERAEARRLRTALDSSSEELGPILDMLTEKEKQLEILQDAVLVAKQAVNDTRAERDEIFSELARTKESLSEKIYEADTERENTTKEKSRVEAELQAARTETAKTVEELSIRTQERDDAEMELDEMLEEREKNVSVIDQKTKALAQAEATVTRLTKDIETLRARETEVAKKLAGTEARLQYAEIALEKAEMIATNATSEVSSKGAVAGEIEERLKVTLKDLHFSKAREAELERQIREAEDRIKFVEDSLMDAEYECEKTANELNALKATASATERSSRNETGAFRRHIDQLTADLARKNQEVEECHDTIGDLDIKVNELESELEITRDELDNNAKMIETMTFELKKLQSGRQGIEALQKEVEQLTLERDELLDRVAEMEQDLDSLMRENKEKISSLTAALDKANSGTVAPDGLKEAISELISIKAELDRKTQELDNSNIKLKDLKDTLQSSEIQREELEDKIDELLLSLNRATDLQDELQGRIRILEDSLNERGKPDGLEGAVTELRLQLQATELERDKQAAKVSELDAKINENAIKFEEIQEKAKVDFDRAVGEVESLKQELETVRTSKLEFSDEANELKAEFEKIIKERDEAIVEVNILKTDIAELERMFEEAQMEIDELTRNPKTDSKEEIQELEQELESALNDIDDLQAQIQKLEESARQSGGSSNTDELELMLEDSKYENEQLSKKLDDATANIAELEKFLDDEKAYTDNIEATNQSLTKEVSSLHERLNRQMELSKADGDTKIIIENLEKQVAKLTADLDAQVKATMKMEEQFNESENVNKELNTALDVADKEIEALNKELDEAYAAKTEEESGASKQLEEMKKILEEKNAALETMESQFKAKITEMEKIEEELRARIEILQEQNTGATESLVLQIEEKESEFKEMRETLVSRLQIQEAEATKLRDESSKISSEFAEVSSKLKTAEQEFDEFRTKAQGLEKRYLARIELVEDAFNQTCAEIEVFRGNLLQAAVAQGIDPPEFKPIPTIPPANYEIPLSPTPLPEKEKKTFLSTVSNVFNRKPSEKNDAAGEQDKENSGGEAKMKSKPSTGILRSLWKGGQQQAAPQAGADDAENHADSENHADTISPSKTPLPDDHEHDTSTSPDAKGVKNKPSTGILRSLWGGKQGTGTDAKAGTPPDAKPSVADPKTLVVGAEDDSDVPKPSTLLASIWGAKSNLKKTETPEPKSAAKAENPPIKMESTTDEKAAGTAIVVGTGSVVETGEP
ncbi:hypothetical protein HDU84_001767 [Entophlyctis sp. JEL0112]|nr:hypothetical protein HDU84_001767 [Entophlyctis sp. JEL0112]